MNIQRFIAPTAREALAKARMTFGDGTLILSNRPTADGIEVVATAEDALASLDREDSDNSRAKSVAADGRRSLATTVTPDSRVEDDVAQLSMSTLSFQDYVRERMLRRRQDASAESSKAPRFSESPPRPSQSASSIQLNVAPPKKPVLHKAPTQTSVSAPAAVPQALMNELLSMKELIEERFDTLTWLGQARQHPIVSNMMLKFVRAGYSPLLARTILEKLPEESDAAESMQWVLDVLERNLKTDAGTKPLFEEGGTYALVGSTGVGKTTTAAKLAGLCAQKHGSSSVGLITLDTYRVGAHEQLRSYGRMLGVVAHLAHDRAALQDLLGLLGNKKMVLIDTTGVAPHDPRRRDMMDVLELPNVNRLLVLNAGSQGDTLDDVVTSFKTKGVQQAVLTKVDEAVKLGPALDAAIRHQLLLRGVTTGQKVPEDWERAEAAKLVRASMRAQGKSAFEPKAVDLGFFFAQSSGKAASRENINA
ncbi:MAG: flagellar biosynthesis protein FlhF [Rhodoferax sp.]|nr:flagellar biosynthesis protein FlhF [Rhodoferax sp.]